MGTAAFETASGLQVDFEFAPVLPVAGGMVCWGARGKVPPSDPGSWDHTVPANYVDCVAYGSYAGPTNAFIGTPTPLTAEGHSLRRISETHDNATDFACGDPADPENNADATADLVATTACPAPPTPQTKAQRRCLLALAKGAAAIGGAHADEIRLCVDGFGKGKLEGPSPTVSACTAGDARAAKAAAKLAAAEAKIPTLFAGSCGAAANSLDLGECVADLGLRLGCIGVELTAGLGLDCDELDGDALHGACFQ